MSQTRLRPAKLHEQLGARLAGDIVSHRLRPDSPIPSEPDLVASFGVSKTVVRETVQALAACGLVRVQHGKRTVVLPETEWNILSPLVQQAFRAEGLAGGLVEELYEVRLLLEPPAARWTAERANEKQVAEIQTLVRAMEESLGDQVVFLGHDRTFHFEIGTTASNRVLRVILRDIHELLNTSWSLTDLSQAEIETVFHQHAAIAEAISGHDGAAAERTMREHLLWAARTDRFTAKPRLQRVVGRSMP